MDQNSKKNVHNIVLALLFVATAIGLSFIFPSTPKFKYDFQKGKPWANPLLTAPFDFPIYKTNTELAQEKNDRLKDFNPYFHVNDSVGVNNEIKFKQFYQQNWMSLGIDSSERELYSNFVLQELQNVYTNGVYMSTELSKLKIDGCTIISVVNNNKAIKVPVVNLWSSQDAYKHILAQSASYKGITREMLQRLNLNNFITPNVSYDDITSKQIRYELINNISLYRGKVQTGERIIDQGEVVNENTFNILNSLKREYPLRMGNATQRMYNYAGNLIIILFACGIIFMYLFSYQKIILSRKRNVIFILLNVLISVSLVRLSLSYGGVIIYALPFILLPIAIRTIFDSRTAITVYLVTIVLVASIVPINGFNFILIEIFAGIFSVYSMKKISKRSELFLVAVVAFVGYVLSYIGIELTQEGSFATIDWHPYMYFGINALLLLFAYPMMFAYEKLFGYVSDITLMELSDTNRTLLRELSEEAPGTFQHCIQVSNMAQAAADAIDANSLLVRTGALYHDIGKMKNPIFFTENQGGGASPHKGLTYLESAKIIINHVHDGVKIAERKSLPSVIIDFIKTHHGTNKAMYFYTSFKNDFPNEPIDEAAFTYPGPMPHSKETAILMMADAIEATSRSLSEYTDENINNVVDRIIDGQLKGGCFENTPLTFKDISVVKEVFKEKLKTMYHTRVQYPTAK